MAARENGKSPANPEDEESKNSFDDANMTLLSQEKLDRSSPELWPEQIPGVSEFISSLPPSTEESPKPEWLKDLDHEDIGVLQGFGSLTAAALMEKVKDLQNLAYQLGLEEERLKLTTASGLDAVVSFRQTHGCFILWSSEELEYFLESKRDDSGSFPQHIFTKQSQKMTALKENIFS